MKLIDRYEFTNGKLFETYLLEKQDTARYNVAECDVIGLRRVGDDNDLMSVMRPDEALIAARLLIGAVLKTTEGYEVVSNPLTEISGLLEDHPLRDEYLNALGITESQPLALELVDDLEGVDHASKQEGRES